MGSVHPESTRRASRLAVWAYVVAATTACGGTQTAPEQRLRASESSAPERSVAAPSVVSASFGQLDGREVQRHTLTNAHGIVVELIDYGAAISKLMVPDREGHLADVVLGCADLECYRAQTSYLGAIVGRVANRIRNAAFDLDGKRYQLPANGGPHQLHGGPRGFDKVLWSSETTSTTSSATVRFRYVSPAGEGGYPGTLTATVSYTLDGDDALNVEMRATTDSTTLVNLAQHTYWNLGGEGSGNVLDHELTLESDAYTPGDPQIPDGRVLSVDGTAFDFTRPKALRADIAATGLTPAGFDHNFVVRGEPHAMRPVARLVEPRSGRVMTLEANQPGVQLYTGNHLRGAFAGKTAAYAQYAGLCLETQAFPDAVNVPAWRGDVLLEPGAEYRHDMSIRFSTVDSPSTPGRI